MPYANSNQLVIAFQSINKDKLSISSYPRIADGRSVAGTTASPADVLVDRRHSSAKHAEEAAKPSSSFFVNDVEGYGKVLGVERGIPCKPLDRA